MVRVGKERVTMAKVKEKAQAKDMVKEKAQAKDTATMVREKTKAKDMAKAKDLEARVKEQLQSLMAGGEPTEAGTLVRLSTPSRSCGCLL